MLLDDCNAQKELLKLQLNEIVLIKVDSDSVFSCQAKHKVDSLHLQLQNLLYEVMHLKKEITKCLEFK